MRRSTSRSRTTATSFTPSALPKQPVWSERARGLDASGQPLPETNYPLKAVLSVACQISNSIQMSATVAAYLLFCRQVRSRRLRSKICSSFRSHKLKCWQSDFTRVDFALNICAAMASI